MPWQETCVRNQRTRFVVDWERKLESMAELCRRYGVSRPSRLEEPEYPAVMEVRRVVDGQLRWRRQRVFVGKGLNGERVGLEAIEEGMWRVWFSFYELGLFDEREWRLRPCPGPAAGRSSGVGPDCGRPPGFLRPAPPRTKSVTYVLGIKGYLCPGKFKSSSREAAPEHSPGCRRSRNPGSPTPLSPERGVGFPSPQIPLAVLDPMLRE